MCAVLLFVDVVDCWCAWFVLRCLLFVVKRLVLFIVCCLWFVFSVLLLIVLTVVPRCCWLFVGVRCLSLFVLVRL